MSLFSPDSDWPVYYNTLKKAGFETIVPFVSVLEEDNPSAYRLLEQAFGPQNSDAGRRQMRQYVRRHVVNLRQGFISVWKDSPDRSRPYRDLGIKLHVLNQKRFKLAFSLPFPTTKSVDESKVNSIMLPTLPTISVWHTRKPW